MQIIILSFFPLCFTFTAIMDDRGMLETFFFLTESQLKSQSHFCRQLSRDGHLQKNRRRIEKDGLGVFMCKGFLCLFRSNYQSQSPIQSNYIVCCLNGMMQKNISTTKAISCRKYFSNSKHEVDIDVDIREWHKNVWWTAVIESWSYFPTNSPNNWIEKQNQSRFFNHEE